MIDKDFSRPIETKVSTYDSVNAFLISSLLLAATAVILMFLVWITMQPSGSFVSQAQQPTYIPVTQAVSNDVKIELTRSDQPTTQEQLDSVVKAVSNVERRIKATPSFRAGGSSPDTRLDSPTHPAIQPEYKRWKLEYDVVDVGAYKKQLDFFDIALGVIAKQTNELWRLRSLDSATQLIDSDRAAENASKSLYFVHESAQLRSWDQKLVASQQISLNDCFTVQFIPESTRSLLRATERQHLNKVGKTLTQVRTTRFKIVRSGNGFAFEVSDMEFH